MMLSVRRARALRDGPGAGLLRGLWPLGLAVALHGVAVRVALHLIGQEPGLGIASTFALILGTLLPSFALVLLVGRFCWAAAVIRPEQPLRWFGADLRRILLDRDRMLGGALALGAMMVFIDSFSILKNAIPAFRPFAWDLALAEADRALHFGTDPWRLLWPLLGHPWAVTALNAAYHLWFLLLYFLFIIAAFWREQGQARLTFLLATVLVWGIGGNLLAVVFSSAGPVYFAAIGLGETFAPQMQALHQFAQVSPVWALDVQRMLWEGYSGNGNVAGISAFPSMHVASTALMMLYGFRIHRRVGQALAVFLALILLGSVVLAWHYALDGYAGVAIAFAGWHAARAIAARVA